MLRKRAVFLAMLILAGCNASTVPTSVISPTLATPKAVATIQLPTITPRPTATSIPSPTATASPTITSTPVGIAPPPGLMFATYGDYGLWQIDADGVSKKILDQLPVSVSTEGSHVVYNDHDVFWLHEVDTGQRFNLTEIVGRQVCCFQWFSARPADVFFNGQLPGKQIPPFTAGFLMLLHLDTKEQQVLDDNHVSFTAPALSPDGQTIAYDRRGEAWLYRFHDTTQEIDLTAYGLSKVKSMVNPAWSPDKSQIAWAVFDGTQWGYGVFNLKEQTVQLFHWHNSAVFEGWPDRAAWSPDGKWLALNIYSEDHDDAGIWIASIDNGLEYRLTVGQAKII